MINPLIANSATAASLAGLVLLHFLWQGSAIAALLALALRGRQRQRSSQRHNFSCAALVLLLVAPVATWVILQDTDGNSHGHGMALVPIIEASLPIVAPPDLAVAPAQNYLAGIAWFWLTGVSVLSLRLAGGWWRAHRLTSHGVSPVDVEWQRRLRSMQDRMQIRRAVRLVESARVVGPLVIGWLRPMILIPAGLAIRLPAAQVEALLLHELAHIRNNDFLINLLQRFAETLLFYHPAVWWVSEQIRRERENRCDDLVVATQGEGRSLASALLTLAEYADCLPATALAAGGNGVTDRIRRLFGNSSEAAPGIGRLLPWILGVVLLSAAGLWVIPRLMAPRLFQSTAQLQINLPTPEIALAGDPRTANWNRLLQSEIVLIRSGAVLGRVMGNMELKEKWKLNDGAQIFARLRNQTRVRLIPETCLVEISAASTNAVEAAEIANSFASSYIEYGLQRHAVQRGEREARLQRSIIDLERMIQRSAEAVRAFETRTAGEGVAIGVDPLARERHREMLDELTDLREIRKQKRRELTLIEFENSTPTAATATQIEGASPSSRPVRWYSAAR